MDKILEGVRLRLKVLRSKVHTLKPHHLGQVSHEY